MNKRLKTMLIMEVITVIAISMLFGIFYLMFTIPSERELWRIKGNNISNPIEVGDSLSFNNSIIYWCNYLPVCWNDEIWAPFALFDGNGEARPAIGSFEKH